MKLANSMRKDWDERARNNAFHYIASWRSDWERDSFFESGEQDYLRLVQPFLDARGWVPPGKVMMELGCGAGRMTGTFAKRFGRVFAVDISKEMLQRAQSYLAEAANITWVHGNGSDLADIPSGELDFVFSYIVLQHIPSDALVFQYVREMLRVLKPQGLFLFQFNSLRKPAMNWKGRTAWALVDLPWMMGFRKASRGIASRLGFDPEVAGRSWRGASIQPSDMRTVVQSAGGVVEDIRGAGTNMAWVEGMKS